MKEKNTELAETMERGMGMFFRKLMDNHRKGLLRPIEQGILFTLVGFQKKGISEVLPSQLSSCMGVHHPAVTPVLNDLETQNYIVRRHSKTDRRKIYVSLTEKGMEFAHDHLKQRHEQILGLIQFIGEEECVAFLNTMERITIYYEQLNQQGGKQS